MLSLLEAERKVKELGGDADIARRTGEILFSHPRMPRRVRQNSRRKDISHKVCAWIKKLQDVLQPTTGESVTNAESKPAERAVLSARCPKDDVLGVPCQRCWNCCTYKPYQDFDYLGVGSNKGRCYDCFTKKSRRGWHRFDLANLYGTFYMRCRICREWKMADYDNFLGRKPGARVARFPHNQCLNCVPVASVPKTTPVQVAETAVQPSAPTRGYADFFAPPQEASGQEPVVAAVFGILPPPMSIPVWAPPFVPPKPEASHPALPALLRHQALKVEHASTAKSLDEARAMVASYEEDLARIRGLLLSAQEEVIDLIGLVVV